MCIVCFSLTFPSGALGEASLRLLKRNTRQINNHRTFRDVSLLEGRTLQLDLLFPDFKEILSKYKGKTPHFEMTYSI